MLYTPYFKFLRKYQSWYYATSDKNFTGINDFEMLTVADKKYTMRQQQVQFLIDNATQW